MRQLTSVDYLRLELPIQRKRYAWAPVLYGLEIAHIDAIHALITWVGDSDKRREALENVCNLFARAYGWHTDNERNADDGRDTDTESPER